MTLLDVLATYGLDAGFAPKLESFITLFGTWNERINLSAARTRDEIVEHVADSLPVVPLLRDTARVIDVGSGGGFPVAIAAICLPHTKFVALEPVHKKHAFLRTVARTLALAHLEPLAERVEAHRDHDYDAAMSRATFDLAAWLERGLELVRPGGFVIGFEAIPRLLPPGVNRVPYESAGKTRSLVVLRRDP